MKFDVYDIINIVLTIVLAYVFARPLIMKTGLTHKNKHVGQAIRICDALAEGIITNYSSITSLTGPEKKKQASQDLMNRIKQQPGINISEQTALERIQLAVDKNKNPQNNSTK